MEDDWENNPERTICFCHNVTLGALKSAIAAGAKDLNAIKEKTCASTGCMGCEPDVIAILDQETKAQKSRA